MDLPKAEISRESALELWNKEHSEYAKQQFVLGNIGIIGRVMKSLNLPVTDEDLFATGIVGLVKSVNTFDVSKGYAFSTYAIPIIRNEILGTFRKKRVDVAISLNDTVDFGDGGSSYADIISDNKTFENDVETVIDLKRFLSKLSEREQKVIFLSYQKDMKQHEIARILGISQPQISRIIKDIRSKWNEA